MRKWQTGGSLATTETEYKMEGRLLLNIVVRKSTAVFKLLPGENKALLIGIQRDSLLVLYLCLNVVDRVRGFNLQCDRLACQRLDINLHSSTQTKDEMECRLLNVTNISLACSSRASRPQ